MNNSLRQFFQVFWKRNIVLDGILIGISIVIFVLSIIELLLYPKNDSLTLYYGVTGVGILAGIHLFYLIIFVFIFLFRKNYLWSFLTMVHSAFLALFLILLISLAGLTLLKGLALSKNKEPISIQLT
jgi:hypothetical protein